MCVPVCVVWQSMQSDQPCTLCDFNKSCNLLGPQSPHLYHIDDAIKPHHNVIGGAKGQSCKIQGCIFEFNEMLFRVLAK